MAIDTSKLKKSTVAWVTFFMINLTASQIQVARTYVVTNVLPQLVHHPKWGAAIVSIFGIALALHRPEVQQLYKKLHDGTLVPLSPGSVVGASPAPASAPVVGTEVTPKP
jgi:hypothetical protein